jgi:hypothetical protein
MPTQDKPYIRLPGTGYRYQVPMWALILLFFVIGILVLLFRGRRVQLWQGKEHLLMVDWDGYREHYKRFGYRDIRAIVVRRTMDPRIVNSILAGIIILFGALMLVTDDLGGRIFQGIIAGCLSLVLTVNLVAGPTCRCWIQTAVQNEEVPSLNRLKRAQKVLARLRPLIAEAQGWLTTEEVSARLQLAAATAPGPAEPASFGTLGQLPHLNSVSGAAPAPAAPAEPRYVADDPSAPPRAIG